METNQEPNKEEPITFDTAVSIEVVFSRIRSRVIGELLIEKGIITRDELDNRFEEVLERDLPEVFEKIFKQKLT